MAAMKEVRLHVAGYADSDAEERADLASQLHEELYGREDVDDFRRGDGPPEAGGAKGNAIEWATLVVTLIGSLPPFLHAVRSWRERHPGCAIVVEIDGDRLTLEDASPEERQELIAAWAARHADG